MSIKMSIPKPGSSLWRNASPWTVAFLRQFHETLRQASASHAQSQIISRYRASYKPPLIQDKINHRTSEVEPAIATLLMIWMAYRRLNASSSIPTLYESETWFLGDFPDSQLISTLVPEWRKSESVVALGGLQFDSSFEELFPYASEAFETQEPYTPRKAIPHKKKFGVYYTPSDVADFIAGGAIVPCSRSAGRDISDIKVIDPACGSGVILRSALGVLKKLNPEKNCLDVLLHSIYGLDYSEQAILSCAFTLFLACEHDVNTPERNPYSIWRSVLANLAVADSTTITLGEEPFKSSLARVAIGVNQGIPSPARLGDIFPLLSRGAEVVMGNPPYSKQLAQESQRTIDGLESRKHIETTGHSLYPEFVEMIWRLGSKEHSHGGMVVPLSISYNSGKEFVYLRRRIMNHGGTWKFQFFDRTPDSLFGDAIKTRSCILHAELDGEFKKWEVYTSPLLRWNIKERRRLFDKLKSFNIGSYPIDDLIPKLGSSSEFEEYRKMRGQKHTIGSLKAPSGSTPRVHSSTVYFRSTAYNWLPVYREDPNRTNHEKEVQSGGFRSITLGSAIEADFVFAVASSRLAYWLWRVEGDGFHLSNSFFESLPFHPSLYSESALQRICGLGRKYWKALLSHPFSKANAGAETISFSPMGTQGILDELDTAMGAPFGLEESFFNLVKEFIASTIIAGRVDFGRIPYAKEHLEKPHNPAGR
jgi:Eco57I restriction-modification methylase